MDETISGPLQSRSPPTRPHIDEPTERGFFLNTWISRGSWGLGGWAPLRSERKWGVRLTSGRSDTLNHSRLRGEELKQSQKTECSGWFWVSGWSMGLSGTRCADSAPLGSYLVPEGSYISHLHRQPKQHFDHNQHAGKIHRPSWTTNTEQTKKAATVQPKDVKYMSFQICDSCVRQHNRNPKCVDNIASAGFADDHGQVYTQQCHSWELKRELFVGLCGSSPFCACCAKREKRSGCSFRDFHTAMLIWLCQQVDVAVSLEDFVLWLPFCACPHPARIKQLLQDNKEVVPLPHWKRLVLQRLLTSADMPRHVL